MTDGHACVIDDVRRESVRLFRCLCSPPSLPYSDHFTPRRTLPAHRQIFTGAWRRVAGPAGRTRRPIDPRRDAVSRFGRARSPASSGDCLYTANNARPTAGLTSAGLDGRTWNGEGGSYCCNSYESAVHAVIVETRLHC